MLSRICNHGQSSISLPVPESDGDLKSAFHTNVILFDMKSLMVIKKGMSFDGSQILILNTSRLQIIEEHVYSEELVDMKSLMVIKKRNVLFRITDPDTQYFEIANHRRARRISGRAGGHAASYIRKSWGNHRRARRISGRAGRARRISGRAGEHAAY